MTRVHVLQREHQDMLKVWQDGYYVFVLEITDKNNKSNVDGMASSFVYVYRQEVPKEPASTTFGWSV